MCGIAGFFSLNGKEVEKSSRFLTVLGDLISELSITLPIIANPLVFQASVSWCIKAQMYFEI